MWNSWECEEWQVCGIRAIESRKIGGGDLQWWWEGSSPDLDSWHKYCILNNGAPGAFSNIARPRNTSPWQDRVCPNAPYSGCRSRWEPSSRGFFERCQAQKHITPAGLSVPQHPLLWLSVTMRAKLQGLFRALPGPETHHPGGVECDPTPLTLVVGQDESRAPGGQGACPTALSSPDTEVYGWPVAGSRLQGLFSERLDRRGLTLSGPTVLAPTLDELRPEKMTKYVNMGFGHNNHPLRSAGPG